MYLLLLNMICVIYFFYAKWDIYNTFHSIHPVCSKADKAWSREPAAGRMLNRTRLPVASKLQKYTQ